MKWEKTEAGKKRLKENMAKYYKDHKEEHKDSVITRQRKMKFVALDTLGHRCTCCGITQWWNLTVDHIIPIRKPRLRGNWTNAQLQHIVDHPEEYQTLCYGCNNSKSDREKCTLPH